MRRVGILALALVICFSDGAIAQPTSAEGKSIAGSPLTADTPMTTTNGATFMAPVGWNVTVGANRVVLAPPEEDSRLVLVDVQAPDAVAAIAAGWASYRPDANRPLRLVTPQATFNGWIERHVFNYETSPNEKAVVYALAWRAGPDWTVTIVEASRSTFQKRNTGFSLIVGSLRAKGYHREMFSGRKAHPLDADRIALLTSFVRDVIQQFGIPGVGLGLIDRGKVVFEGGLGLKTLGMPGPVDADTLFLAASNTKAMTTLLLAKLVDEHKLQWDQPVTEIYPSFRLGNADTTRQVLVKHLLCACTGLPRQDFEWLFNYGAATPASSLASLGAMQPTTHFGEAYQYSNVMAAAAGYIAASVINPGQELGAAYDAAMRSKVFAPLGMSRTTFDFAKAMSGNFASPHGDDVDGKTILASMDINYSIVPMRPAGGMWTSARDLTNYLQMELALGVLADGTRLVSQESLLERRKGQIQMGEDTAYGMGLVINTRDDIPVVHHGGSLFGYKSDMMFLPDHGVGVVILTNSDTGGHLTGLLRRRLLEVLFDGKPTAVEQAKVALAQRAANIAKNRERLVVPADAAVVGKLAARYVSPTLGELRIRAQDGSNVFDFGTWRSAVASRRNDDGTTSLISINPTVGGFNFVVGERDGKRALIIREAQHEHAFVEGTSPQ
jgi:CubicO group peptidase (beta-lactamase class C family)